MENCLEKFEAALKAVLIPRDLIRAFKDDCNDLNDCFTLDCMPIIDKPKEDNKFLSFIPPPDQLDPIQEYVRHDEYIRRLYSYLTFGAEKVIEYYERNKEFDKIVEIVSFLMSPELIKKYKRYLLLEPGFINYILRRIYDDYEDVIPIDEELIKGLEIIVFHDNESANLFSEAVKKLPKVSREYGERLLPIMDYLLYKALYNSLFNVARVVSEAYPELVEHYALQASFCFELSSIEDVMRRRMKGDILDILNILLCRINESIPLYFLNLSLKDRRYIPSFFNTFDKLGGRSDFYVLEEFFKKIPVVNDEILKYATPRFICLAYEEGKIDDPKYLVDMILNNDGKIPCSAGVLKKYRDYLVKINDVRIVKTLVYKLEDKDLFMKNMHMFLDDEFLSLQFLGTAPVSLLKEIEGQKNFDKIICEIICYTIPWDKSRAEELIRNFDVIKYGCCPASLEFLSVEEIRRRKDEIYEKYLKNIDKDWSLPYAVPDAVPAKVLNQFEVRDNDDFSLLDLLILTNEDEETIWRYRERIKGLLKKSKDDMARNNLEILLCEIMKKSERLAEYFIDVMASLPYSSSCLYRIGLTYPSLVDKMPEDVKVMLSLELKRPIDIKLIAKKILLQPDPTYYLSKLSDDEIEKLLEYLGDNVNESIIDALIRLKKTDLAIKFMLKNVRKYAIKLINLGIVREDCEDIYLENFSEIDFDKRHLLLSFVDPVKVIEKDPYLYVHLPRDLWLDVLVRAYMNTKNEEILKEIFYLNPSVTYQLAPNWLEAKIWALYRGIIPECEEVKCLAILSVKDKDRALKCRDKVVKILSDVGEGKDKYYALIYAINVGLDDERIHPFWRRVIKELSRDISFP